MQFDTYIYTIGAHFLPAIINGDESGLETYEQNLLASFDANLPSGHWSFDSADDGHFARCDITGEMSQCIDCEYLVPIVGDHERSHGPWA